MSITAEDVKKYKGTAAASSLITADVLTQGNLAPHSVQPDPTVDSEPHVLSFAELKELIAMHGNEGQLGGDLKTDTVTIIGGALDLQEKVWP